VCGQCRHQFSDPDTWPSDIAAEYTNLQDDDYVELFDVKRRTFKRAANVLDSYVLPHSRILEVGSYAGLFLAECKNRGHEVRGIEPSRWGVEIARSQELQVDEGAAEDLLFQSDLGDFDAVVSWDVLEHVKDPQHFLRGLSERCRDGGYVFVSTLDRTNWFARFTGRRWPWLIPMHLHYFDKKTVQNLGTKVGLQPISTLPHVHYTNASYALSRLIGHGATIEKSDFSGILTKLIFPVGFGDVRLFVFQKGAQ
jgi:SAM-dependent methyltransferase